MLFPHPQQFTVAEAWLEQRLHRPEYLVFSWKPVEVIRALSGCVDHFLIIGKESGNRGAKSESHDIFIASCESLWECFSRYYFSLCCLLHLLPFKIATKKSHRNWESLPLLILQTIWIIFENGNTIHTYKPGWLLTGCHNSLEVSDAECTCSLPEFGSLWYWGIFSSSLRNLWFSPTCKRVPLYFTLENCESMANAVSSKCVHISLQRTYELFVPDTLHNMLPGFKKTLFHVLTLISLFCPLREQRTSLLYAAVICPISLLFLTSISLWYLVKVIFS